MNTDTKTFQATIGRSNDNGFQIDERPGVWLNFSKFSDPRPTIPPVGSIARITVDAQNYVRAIVPVDEPQLPLTGATRPAAAPAPRDLTITRLAVLKAAVRFLEARPEAKHQDVLALAEIFETWVTRHD